MVKRLWQRLKSDQLKASELEAEQLRKEFEDRLEFARRALQDNPIALDRAIAEIQRWYRQQILDRTTRPL